MELKMALSYHPLCTEGSLCSSRSLDSVNCRQRKDFCGVFWLGTHGDGPARIKGKGKTLKQYLNEHPEFRCGDNLPFMLRIVSTCHTLPLMCHPDKEQSSLLHERIPGRYPDKVPKDLTYISIGYSLLMCGLRPHDQIIYYLKTVPELSILIPCDDVANFILMKSMNIKDLLHSLFTGPIELRKLATECYFTRMKMSDEYIQDSHLYSLVKNIHRVHAYDAGIFSPFFFNNLILSPGEGFSIPTRMAYSLIYGDLIEFGSTSVTTIKVALTNDYRDVHYFLEMAELSFHDINTFKLKKKSRDLCSTVYKSPFQEQAVDRITIPEGVSHTFPIHNSCSLVLLLRGTILTSSFRIYQSVTSLFIATNEEFKFTAKEDTTLYQIYNCPLDTFKNFEESF